MYENKNSYNFYFFDLLLIFLFYVLGDTITTWTALRLGHIEMNGLMAPIVNMEYGILIVLGLKLIFFIWLLYLVVSMHRSNLVKVTMSFIACMGIFISFSNAIVILTGYNVFQLIGVM